MQYDKTIVEGHWSKNDCSASEKNFYCFPPLRKRACKLIFGENDAGRKDWCEYWTIEKYLKNEIPFNKCLSICCGFGEVERVLSKLGLAKKIIGIDIAPGAIDFARKQAESEKLFNIEYHVSDMNSTILKDDEYDIIWANGALHHIKELEIVVPQLINSLKPGGYLISNEYVGPDYQQVSQRQEEIISAVKHILPSYMRENQDIHRPYGNSFIARLIRYYKRRFPRKDVFMPLWRKIPVKQFLNTDPSECICSSRIIPVLQKYFEQVIVKHFNGSILSYALDAKFYDNFDSKNENHNKILELLFYIEDMLVACGEISNDNAHIICKKNLS